MPFVERTLAGKRNERSISNYFISKLLSAARTHTGRNALWVVASQGICGFLGFVVNVIIIRTLPVADYGRFSLFTSAYMLLGGLFHLGRSDTYVRFGTIHRAAPFSRALRKRVGQSIALSSTALALASLLICRWAVQTLYHRDESYGFLLCAVGVALMNTWLSFFLADLRVASDYRGLLRLNVGVTLFRVFAVTALVSGGALGLASSMGVYLLAPIVCLVYCLGRQRLSQQPQVATDGRGAIPTEVALDISKYNFWIFFNIITFTLIGNLDSQIIAYFHHSHSVADFGVTARLTLPLCFLITAINTTLLPRISASHRVAELRMVLSKLGLVIFPAAACLLALALVGAPLLLRIAGNRYAGAAPLMTVQLFCTLASLFWLPGAVILQGMGRAQSIAWLSFTQLLIIVGLDFAWIPGSGAMGAARAALVGHVFGIAWVAVHLIGHIRAEELRERPHRHHQPAAGIPNGGLIGENHAR